MKPTTFHAQRRKGQNSVSVVMLQVLVALIPGIGTMWWFFGWGVFIQLALAIIIAVSAEAMVLYLRRKPIVTTLLDFSAVLTATLLALSLPPLAPWWVTVNGALFAIVIAKQLYGGLGYNPFNPAMAGYVALLLSFPQQMTGWNPPLELNGSVGNFSSVLQTIFTNTSADSITMATPLDTVKTELRLNKSIGEITSSPLYGTVAGMGWEWIATAFLFGGCGLLANRAIAWQIPIGFLGGLATMASIFYLQDDAIFLSPAFHLFSGGAMLGAFFIATDPVTAATTSLGRILYGIIMGVIVYVIRTWGGYPDAIAFAILLLNLAAPTIDHFTRPRTVVRSS